MAVLYPQGSTLAGEVAWIAPFDQASLAKLVDSPARRQLVEKLVEGESAVWLFLASGDDKLDRAALQRLEQRIASDREELKLPEQDPVEAAEFFSGQPNIALKVSFSVVTVDRTDAREAFLVASLLNSEPDLRELNEPLAFPVLGRGRVLYALAGEGVCDETVSTASRFIIGPCSCQVKDQNPGFDLLIRTAWEEHVGSLKLSRPLPEGGATPVLVPISPGKR